MPVLKVTIQNQTVTVTMWKVTKGRPTKHQTLAVTLPVTSACLI